MNTCPKCKMTAPVGTLRCRICGAPLGEHEERVRRNRNTALALVVVFVTATILVAVFVVPRIRSVSVEVFDRRKLSPEVEASLKPQTVEGRDLPVAVGDRFDKVILRCGWPDRSGSEETAERRVSVYVYAPHPKYPYDCVGTITTVNGQVTSILTTY